MKKIFITIIVLIVGLSVKGETDLPPDSTILQLQLHKSLFISGEKIWFKNTIASTHSNSHQTILYVDLCGEGVIINKSIIKRHNNHWQGDLLIPDSLETGIYLFRAYSGNYDGKAEITTKLITIINKFGHNKTNENRKLEQNYEPVNLFEIIPSNSGSSLKVYANAPEFHSNTPIDLWIENNSNTTLSGISLSVFKIPDNALCPDSIAVPEHKVQLSNLKNIKIYNRLSLTGQIIDKDTKQPIEGETVLFSIPDSVPQINYSLTDKNGEFIFIADEYYGTQDLIVQTLSKERNIDIILFPYFLEPPAKIPYFLNSELENSEFVTLAVKRFLLENAYGQSVTKIYMDTLFKYPFYGSSTNSVLTERYIDLNDFQEITKELLPLCRIKKEKNNFELKIYQPDNFQLFESPWILLDGIPVFDIKLLFPLNSQSIRKIDTQPEVRCYGGLYIEGALSVFTKEGNYSNIALPKNSVRKVFDTYHISDSYVNIDKSKPIGLPDFRDVLYWDPMIKPFSTVSKHTILCSYEKGSYVAVAQLTDEHGMIHRSVFKFLVK